MEPAPTPSERGRLGVVLTAVTAGALLAAGCGSVGYTEGTGDRSKGKELFVQKCGSCHTLADAGTKGQVGPNLDYAFFESRRNGLGESTIVQVVRGQIAYPITNTSTGAPGMPANLVEGQDADDVASYVGSVAGVGDPNAAAPAPSPAPTPTPEPAPGRRRGRRRRQGGVCDGRLHRLSHARGGRIDRQRRPESRRCEAGRCPRDDTRHERARVRCRRSRGSSTRPRSPTWPPTSRASPASKNPASATATAARHRRRG